jgi:hypothetical protein
LNETVARALPAAVSRTATSTPSISQSCASMKGSASRLAHLAARLSAILDDERRQGGREIAPHRRVIGQLDAFCILALVLVIDRLHE